MLRVPVNRGTRSSLKSDYIIQRCFSAPATNGRGTGSIPINATADVRAGNPYIGGGGPAEFAIGGEVSVLKGSSPLPCMELGLPGSNMRSHGNLLGVALLWP